MPRRPGQAAFKSTAQNHGILQELLEAAWVSLVSFRWVTFLGLWDPTRVTPYQYNVNTVYLSLPNHTQLWLYAFVSELKNPTESF